MSILHVIEDLDEDNDILPLKELSASDTELMDRFLEKNHI